VEELGGEGREGKKWEGKGWGRHSMSCLRAPLIGGRERVTTDEERVLRGG